METHISVLECYMYSLKDYVKRNMFFGSYSALKQHGLLLFILQLLLTYCYDVVSLFSSNL